MAIDHTPAKELLEAAAKAVNEAGVPEPLQQLAFAKAFDYLGGESAASPTTRRAAGRAKPKKAARTTKATAKRPRRRAGARPQKNAELAAKLTPEVRQALQEYRDARSTGFDAKTTNAVTIIACFLIDELDLVRVDESDLYTVYSVMGWPTPNLTSALGNAYNREKFFGGLVEGKRDLTQAGENFARHTSLNQ